MISRQQSRIDTQLQDRSTVRGDKSFLIDFPATVNAGAMPLFLPFLEIVQSALALSNPPGPSRKPSWPGQ
jgi:hypothetical protein